MASKLDKAKAVIEDLKKAVEAGEDLTKDEVTATAPTDIVAAQQTEILKALGELQGELKKSAPAAIKKAEDEESEEDKKEDAKEAAEAEDKKEEEEPEDMAKSEEAVLLDLALEEIVRLRKGKEEEYPPVDEKKSLAAAKLGKKVALKKAEDDEESEEDEKEDKKEEEEDKEDAPPFAKAVKKDADPGPAADLKKPSSTDYTDSKESVQKSINFTQAQFDAAVKKSVESQVQTLMKSAGFVASTTPITPVAAESAAQPAGNGEDLTKSYEKFVGLPWKAINKFRMQTDPNFRNLSNNYLTMGRG